MNPVTPFAALRLALTEAKKGAGFVAPNPLVGCTILDRHFNLLSVGYHTAIGKAHAEVEALKKISDVNQLVGAHVFVTLEPCAHIGRTPSCAQTLSTLPIASVIYGLEDPNPLVAGKGAEILKKAGKAVLNLQTASAQDLRALFTGISEFSEGELVDLRWQVEQVAEIFLHNIRTQMPFVTLKVAASLDGQMALRSGESKWITSESARDHVHLLRAAHDAVLVGRRTFVVDNPSLNVRHMNYPEFANRAILIDPRAATLAALAQSNLRRVHKPEQIFIVVDSALLKQTPNLHQGQEVIIGVDRLPEGSLDLKSALKQLFAHRVTSIFVEGGSLTHSQFLKQRLAQRLYLFSAPVIIGAGGGISWTQGFAIDHMRDRLQLNHPEFQQFGSDLMTTGRLEF